MTSWNPIVGIFAVIFAGIIMFLLFTKRLNREKLNTIGVIVATAGSFATLCLLFVPSTGNKEATNKVYTGHPVLVSPVSSMPPPNFDPKPVGSTNGTDMRSEKPYQTQSPEGDRQSRDYTSFDSPSKKTPSMDAIYLNFRREAFNALLEQDLELALKNLRKASPYAIYAQEDNLSKLIMHLESIKSNLAAKGSETNEEAWNLAYKTILSNFAEIVETKYRDRFLRRIANKHPSKP